MTTNTVRLNSVVPVLPVDDLAKTLAFYSEQLGFATAFTQGEYGGVTRGDVEMHLDGTTQGVRGMTIRVRVDGVDELYGEMDAQGIVDPAEPLNTKPWGSRQFSVLDCCGNRITFVQEA